MRADPELAGRNPGLWPDLAGMAIAAQGDGLWPVDRAGRPVRPAILWNDTRAKRLDLPELPELDRFCAGHAVTRLFPGAAPMLLLWLRRHEPEQYARTARALHCKDWLNYCLTGELATDFSDASTAALDVETRRYVPGLLERMGIPEALALLPEPRGSAERVGRVTPAAAQRTGLPSGLEVMTGALDVAAVAVGADADRPGAAVTIIGTTLCSEVAAAPGQGGHGDAPGSTLCHGPAGPPPAPDGHLQRHQQPGLGPRPGGARPGLRPGWRRSWSGSRRDARARCSTRTCTGSGRPSATPWPAADSSG